MVINDSRDLKMHKNNRILKGIGLAGLLLMITLAGTACNRPAKESSVGKESVEDTVNQPSDSPDIKQDADTTHEPEPTNEPDISEADPTEAPANTPKPAPTGKPSPTEKPEPTVAPTPAGKPSPTEIPVSMTDFTPSKEVLHSTTALTQGDYLFYKTGKLTNTVIAAKNLNTSQVFEITTIEDTYFNSTEFFLKESDIYYHAEGDIYRVGVDGTNKERLFKGTATMLGFYEDDLYAVDSKAREIIRINQAGEKTSFAKLNSKDPLEAVMVRDGFYYISKSTNNTLKDNDPIDRLYYIDFEGKNKTEIYADLDIFHLKRQEDEVFVLTLSDIPEEMKLIKVKDREATILHSNSREELEAQGCRWLDMSLFTLLAVNDKKVYYGINFNNGETLNIYSVETDGKNHGLFLNAYDIEGMNPSAYFRRGDMDGDYLKIVFDCDEDPVEVYLIDLQDKSTMKFEGGYYLSATIDVEGDYVYYLKSKEYDHYSEKPEEYEYGQSKLSELR